jgi:hypothetical protein
MAEANSALPAEKRIELRIRINLGDGMVEGSDLFGDRVKSPPSGALIGEQRGAPRRRGPLVHQLGAKLLHNARSSALLATTPL